MHSLGENSVLSVFLQEKRKETLAPSLNPVFSYDLRTE